MYDELCKWGQQTIDHDGVIVGCCQNQEWLLPWWWMHFKMHNQYPVTFVDFGDMTSIAREFCQKRGQLITLNIPESFITPKEKLNGKYESLWKRIGLDLETSRSAWFKKPFACLQSPYKRAMWIDLDCQTRLSIEPIFDYCENSWQIAIGIEPPIVQQMHERRGTLYYGEIEYNTGVIVFKHGCPTIQEWAKFCIKRNESLRGDQEALSRMAFENDIQLPLLEPIHNCRAEMREDLNVKSVIIFHWLGGSKHHIKGQINLLENSCDIDFSMI